MHHFARDKVGTLGKSMKGESIKGLEGRNKGEICKKYEGSKGRNDSEKGLTGLKA